MIQWASNPKKLKNILLGYWLVVPILFYLYLIITGVQMNQTVQELVQTTPTLLIGNLVSSLMLFQAGLLFFISHISQSKDGLLGKFALVSIIQQVVTGNIIGVVLAFFFRRSLLAIEEENTANQRLIFYIATGFSLLLSILVLFITLRLRGV